MAPTSLDEIFYGSYQTPGDLHMYYIPTLQQLRPGDLSFLISSARSQIVLHNICHGRMYSPVYTTPCYCMHAGGIIDHGTCNQMQLKRVAIYNPSSNVLGIRLH